MSKLLKFSPRREAIFMNVKKDMSEYFAQQDGLLEILQTDL